MIVKGGAMIATVWAESIPYWGTASSVAVISLEPGEQVWLLIYRVEVSVIFMIRVRSP